MMLPPRSPFFTGFIYIELIGLHCQLRAHADELECRLFTDADRHNEMELKCCAKKQRAFVDTAPVPAGRSGIDVIDPVAGAYP
ncbi:hypothetical protein GTU79_09040 [Sodalis ligni]|uniref:hypothetical protein n=1 Tax=Sodalis ligni TaxID=2697027 RepID=UPI001BDEC554|nr:hypothetical protein [Sodalis ligni]QWA12802.1 hypothetical protein GTU79_09040 [Sodalis ligni]